MSGHFVPRVGGVSSADIAVPEHEREVRFYSRVLTTGENPLWREDLMNNVGMPIVGLGARIAELEPFTEACAKLEAEIAERKLAHDSDAEDLAIKCGYTAI